MLPSSSRVKLNRVALKDVVGLQLVPRRRRVQKLPGNEKRGEVPAVKHTTSVLGSGNEPVCGGCTDSWGPAHATQVGGRSIAGDKLGKKDGPGVGAVRRHCEPGEGTDMRQWRADSGRDTIPRHADSEVSPRRLMTPSRCRLCRDCSRYKSLQSKARSKQGQKSCNQGSEQFKFEENIKRGNPESERTEKVIVWTDQYPKLALCNIAQKFDMCSHKCRYLLPDALKTRVVHCFKQELRDGCLLKPTCSGQNSQESVDSALANHCKSGTSTFQSQCVTENQRHLKKCTESNISFTHHFAKGWTNDATADFPTSLLRKGDTGEHRTSMWERAVERPEPGCDLIDAEFHTDKRMKLGEHIKEGCHAAWMPGGRQPGLDHSFGSFSTYRATVEEACVNKEPCGRIGRPREMNAAQMPSELSSESDEVDVDDPGSFTCQRVIVFCNNKSYCARTNMPWPFSDNSHTITAHASSTASPMEPVQPSAGYSNSPVNQDQSSSGWPKDVLSGAAATTKISPQNVDKQEKNGECVATKSNGEKGLHMSSIIRNTEFTACFMDAEESLVAPPSVSSISVNEQETDSSRSTSSPSALGLSDWEVVAGFYPMSSMLTPGGLNSLPVTLSSDPLALFQFGKVTGHSSSTSPTSSSLDSFIKAVETPLFHCEETKMTFYSSSPRPSPKTSTPDSFPSSESSLLLPQDKRSSDKVFFVETSPLNHDRLVAALPYSTNEQCEETNSSMFTLPPLLSPVTTPQRHQFISFLSQSLYSSDKTAVGKEEEAINKHTNKLKILPGYDTPQISNGLHQSCEDSPDHIQCEKSGQVEESEGASSKSTSPLSLSSVGDERNIMEEDREDESQLGNICSEQVPLAPNIKSSCTSGVVTRPCPSPGSDEEQQCSASDEESSPSETEDSESDQTKAEAADSSQSCLLDEITAYEQDILLLDVVQDDPELFENLPKGSLIKLGPTRVIDTSARNSAASPGIKQRLTPAIVEFCCDSPDITEENDSRSWRPRSSSSTTKMTNNTWKTRTMGQSDANNNHVNGGMERSYPIQTEDSTHDMTLKTIRNVSRITSAVNGTDCRLHKSNSYCRQYFSESLSCGFKMCRFQHLPMEGDEKFCIDTVTRFSKNPMCLQKARAVFTGYYNNNPPGLYFSMAVFLTLLWALLKAGLVTDVFSVLSISLAHKIPPNHEYLLALFNFVREKGLTGYVAELMQLTFEMASAGLTLDSLDCLKNTAEFQQVVNPASSGSQRLNSSSPEYLTLAQTIVEIELCAKQQEWRTMGKVFRFLCHSSAHPNQLEQISGSIAIALLSESKNKLSVPFAVFAETVYQSDDEDSPVRSYFGRIGVSLMLRYHKTRQWDKGRKVVEVLSYSKVNYSTLKGLFGNEDSASRCCLITLATEFFLCTNSVAGALITLKENNWFLSSSLWPCELEDLETRSCVLMRLALKASHRDTLDILCNLPGIKEPNDLIDVSRYGPVFNSHLQVCVDRTILPVASDTVDFMFSKKLPVYHTLLMTLLHKLGKQNLWRRARELFRHSLSVGYYTDVSAPPGAMALIVPWRLEEVELALTFEMFITANAAALLNLSETTTSRLSITLKRTESDESKYLSAGSRLLSAACIPKPNLIVRYMAVNSSQEQVFTLDISSARRWIHQNHLWANGMWKH